MYRLLKYSCLREIYKRNVQSANYTNPCDCAPEMRHVTLCNGIKVATSRPNQPLAMLTITCQAGSRFEKHHELGVSHFLRKIPSLTGRMSAFIRIRKFQQLGTHFVTTGGREFISYTLIGMKSKIEISCRYLVDAVFHNEFRPYEIDDLRPKILLELDTIDPRSLVMDLLHKAAFRCGLGNPIYCPRHKVSEIDQDMLRNYIEDNFTTNRCFISSVGLDDGLAICIGEGLCLKEAAGTSLTSCRVAMRPPYVGRGEAVLEGGERRTVVALGVRADGDKHVVAARAALACGLRSALRTQLGGLGAEADFFSVDYGGFGLFGVYLETERHNIARICTRAALFLKTDLARIDEKAAQRAKHILASNILRSVDSSEDALHEMAMQMARGVCFSYVNDVAQNVLALNEKDIISTGKALSKNELTVAANGDVHLMPTVHELCCI